MMKFLTASLFLFASYLAKGQLTVAGAQHSGMGNITAISYGISSLTGNQAGLTKIAGFSAFAGAEHRFLLSELNTVYAGAALATKSGTFGLLAQRFGFEEFKQQKVGLAYARKLWKAVALGAQFDYFQTRIPEYGSKGIFTFEMGMQAALTKEFTIGVHVFSPAQVEWVEDQRLPTVFKMGLAYLASENATIAFELEKDVDFPLRLKGGIEYQPAKLLFLRAGFGTNPSMIHFGIGLSLSTRLRVDVASSYHQTLGLSPAATVIFDRDGE